MEDLLKQFALHIGRMIGRNWSKHNGEVRPRSTKAPRLRPRTGKMPIAHGPQVPSEARPASVVRRK